MWTPPSPGRVLQQAGNVLVNAEQAVGNELNRVIDKVQDAATAATGNTRSTVRNPQTGQQQDLEIHDPRFDAFVKTVDDAFKAVRAEIADLRISGGGMFGGGGGAGGIDPLMLVLLLNQGEDAALSTTDILIIMMSQNGQNGGGFGGGGNALLPLLLLQQAA